MKPILFNTEMVRAILDGRKTVTRRVVKPQQLRVLDSQYHKDHPVTLDKVLLELLCKPPYRPGDILYVRETWAAWSRTMGTPPVLYYKADGDAPDGIKWSPSIHMPKEAARLFLRVKDVRVERLQDITRDGAVREGANPACAVLNFRKIWDSTIKPADRATHGWAANPWVWVIEFERITMEEAGHGTAQA